MQHSDPILEELRKISAWADMQRKMMKWSLIFIAVFIPVMILVGVIIENRLKSTFEDITSDITSDSSMDWNTVDRNARRGDFDSAIQMGQKLIERTPLDPEAHRRLARVFLAAGRIQDSERHYAEVYRLFPSEDARELLEAVRKRAQSQNVQQ